MKKGEKHGDGDITTENGCEIVPSIAAALALLPIWQKRTPAIKN
jgi:hypothetical protein